MQNKSLETIVALATPPGRGGVAIVRISGHLVKEIAHAIVTKPLKARYAVCSSFIDSSNTIIDTGIALFFPAPHSFTGEDILELQTHGGPIISDILIRQIIKLGARLAKPGEFTERAFLNDKIDLVQAEAIADLIDACSEQAARAAMLSLQGEFSKKINKLVEALIYLRTYIEAAIDFVEEEIDFLADNQIETQLIAINNTLQTIQQEAFQGSLLREGITAVIAGLPNAGKSSLLNQLSGKEAAIVTPIPGTTRDLLREHIMIDGMPLHIIDTAGLRDSDDLVEQEGIKRAHAEIARADLILFVVDANDSTIPQLNLFIKNIPPHAKIITIHNKIDLLKKFPTIIHKDAKTEIYLSAKTGEGVELLKQHIKSSIGAEATQEGVFSARRRHLDALSRASSFIQNGLLQLKEHRAAELLAEDLRQAQLALNEITGSFTTNDLLGKIFSSFCVGK